MPCNGEKPFAYKANATKRLAVERRLKAMGIMPRSSKYLQLYDRYMRKP